MVSLDAPRSSGVAVVRRDIRGTNLFLEAKAIYESTRQPGSGQIFDAADLNVSPDGRYAVFTGSLVDTLEEATITRICRTEIPSGETHIITRGPGRDRLPKHSPDSCYLAFLSDRDAVGNFQLQ